MLGLTASLASCNFVDSFVPKQGERTDVIDRQQGLTLEDFQKINKIDKDDKIMATAKAGPVVAAPPVPDLAQVLAAPKPPKVANTKLVTLSVTEDVPLRDVLFELGRLANVDIEVGSGLDKQGINLRATDRPFNEVIERIAELGHLRYSVNGSSIRVERDVPYIKNYSLDFLNIVRSSTSTYNLTTNILASGGGGSSSGGSSSGGSSSSSTTGVGTSGSSSNITSQADSDIWSSLEASVTEILNARPDDAQKADDQNNPSSTNSTNEKSSASFVINRQAGVLSVNATEAQHEMVRRFLQLMSRNASAQVLIEAKVVEVSLSDQFLSGINWSKLIGDASHANVSFGDYTDQAKIDTYSLNPGVTGNAVTLGLSAGDLDAVMAMTQRFGTTRTLSSPRLSAINNQQAVLTFARNEVFFDCTATPPTTTSTSGNTSSSESQPTVDCEQQTVPIGIILSILPSINLDSQEITLNARPTLTRQVSEKTNPEQGYIQSLINASSDACSADPIPEECVIPPIAVPVIEVRELDSITKVKSGGVMVIGGLMQDSTRNTVEGVPGMQEIPLFGNFFKSRAEDSTKTELVIFIKATIVNPDGSSGPVDRAVYEKFVTDPRPLFPQQ